MDFLSRELWEDGFLEECLKMDCQLIIDALNKGSESYSADLIRLVENSKTLSKKYCMEGKRDEMLKYEIMGESALIKLNNYLFD